MESPLASLLSLSHKLGLESRRLAILGEGNTSAKLSDDSFLVKASGSNLATLSEEGVVECKTSAILELLESSGLDDKAVDDALLASRADPAAKKPSVEALFHGWLLTLPGINFIGHTHPIPCNQVLCSPLADRFANSRIFPDEIVCCGTRSVIIPYTDPGLKLAQTIRDKVKQFIEEEGQPPRIILLANHGVIALGSTPNAVEASMLMCSKSAEIFFGAAALGGPVFLTPENVARITGRPDEHYRRNVLKL